MQYAATAQSNTQLHLTPWQKLLSLTKTFNLTYLSGMPSRLTLRYMERTLAT